MKIIKNLFFSFLLLATLTARAQQPKTCRDSLIAQIPRATEIEKFHLYIDIARGFWYVDFDSTYFYAQKALDIAKKLKKESFIARAYKETGNVYYFKSNYVKALDNYKEAIRHFKEAHDFTGIVHSEINIGLVYEELGLFNKAIQYYIKASELAKEHNLIRELYGITNNMGNIYYRMENYKQALESYTEAYEKAIEEQNQKHISNATNNLGSVNIELGNYPEAEKFLKESLHTAKKSYNISGIVSATNNLGKLYFIQHQYNTALQYYRQSLRHAIQSELAKDAANTLRNIGGIYLTMQQYDSAYHYFHRTEEIADSNGYIEISIPLKLDFADLFEKTGDLQQAITAYKSYMSQKDSISKKNNEQELSELQTIYETEEKDFRNKILKQENDVIRLELKNQRYIIFLGIAVLIILIAITLLLFMRYRVVERQKSELIDKNRKITEQNIVMNKALSKISESELKYKTLVNNLNAGVCLVQNAEIIFGNETVSYILVGEKRELTGNYLEDYIVNEDIALLEKTIEEVARTKSSKIIALHTVVEPSKKISARFNFLEYLGKPAQLCIFDECKEYPLERTKEETKKTEPVSPSYDPNRLKILIVDDDELNLMYLLKILQKEGCQVLAVDNGREAIDRYFDYHPDLVLMDIQMPDMDGFQLSRRLRKLEEDKGVEPTIIVAVTAYISDNEEQEYKRSGINALLAKPFQSKDIRRIIKQYFPG